MLTQEVLVQLQKHNFDLLARQEPSGRRRLRYMALAHINDGKSAIETALALRETPSAVTASFLFGSIIAEQAKTLSMRVQYVF